MVIKELIQEKDVTSINTYEPNIGGNQSVKQIITAIKAEINSNPIVVGTLTLHYHQWTVHSDRKLIRRQTLNDRLDQMGIK